VIEKEQVMGEGDLIRLKHNIYMSEMPGQNPLGLSMYTLKKNEGQEGKAGVFWRWVPVGGGRA
jgi:hypothetical protein